MMKITVVEEIYLMFCYSLYYVTVSTMFMGSWEMNREGRCGIGLCESSPLILHGVS
jgi:hypothetical protein